MKNQRFIAFALPLLAGGCLLDAQINVDSDSSAITVGFTTTATATTGSTTGACGDQGCQCFVDTDCNAGLACQSGVCVFPGPAGCGNGLIEGGEECDDAGMSPGCDWDCTIPECHDGIWNWEVEECDESDPMGPAGCMDCILVGGTGGDTGGSTGGGDTGGGMCSSSVTNLGGVLPLVEMSTNAGEPNNRFPPCNMGEGPDKTYEWTPPTDGFYVVRTSAPFEHSTYVTSGSCDDSPTLSCEPGWFGPGFSPQTHAGMFLSGNVPVNVTFDGVQAGDKGDFTLQIDDAGYCIDQNILLTSGNFPGDNTGLANDITDSQCGAMGPIVGDYSYRWTAQQAGFYDFTLNSALNHQMNVLDGECFGNSLTGCAGAGTPYSVAMAAGQQVTIHVDNASGQEGPFSLDIALNALCPETDLGSALGTFPGTTIAAPSLLNGSCGGSGSEKTFTWQAPVDGMFQFDTMSGNTDFDTVVYLFADGNCGGNELECNDDELGQMGQSRVEHFFMSGEQVTIVVDGHMAAGNFDLNISQII